MSSFRSRARRLAFGDRSSSSSSSSNDKNDNLSASEASSVRSSSHSSVRSSSSHGPFRNMFRHSSSISEQCSCGQTNKLSDKSVRLQPRRTNCVRKIHRSQPFELFVEALEQDGCVIVQDFVNPQIPAQVQSAGSVTLFDDNGEEDRGRTGNPLDLNALIRESLLNDSLYQILSAHFLTLETISWSSHSIDMSISKPRLFASTTRDLGDSPGTITTTQSKPSHPSPSPFSFHRADRPLHKRHYASSRYDYQSRRDTTLGLLVPELDSLSDTVLLRVIPGSHLWDDSKPDTARGVKQLHLRAGDALILLGSLYHALGDADPIDPEVHIGSGDSDLSKDKDKGCAARVSASRTSSTASTAGSVASSHSRSSFRSATAPSTLQPPRSPKEKLLHSMWMSAGIYRPAHELLAEEDGEYE